ncbi:tyrosine-type recombinase/integrase [Draconibacterium sp. IB214405]|uniref:tyrosine-type recombinase/integrase n=1 Tax=Draconibacterium sp. IB214405 TaxID=3097352 RepID=UPI002A0CB541|nr:tyrosine-type recombinase/integrase [Draconibacterium sp. IB214405]MDX8341762.1 tyrosine-type recombinase/integrase [Draconibacterium sp. IB214405]
MESTFKNYLNSQGRSTSTIVHYVSYINKFENWLNNNGSSSEKLQMTELIQYLHFLQDSGISNITRAIRLNVIKQYFEYLCINHIRTNNPAIKLKIRGTKQKKLYPQLTSHDLERIYKSYKIPALNSPLRKRNWFNKYRLSKMRNKAILNLMINQGLLTTELIRLEFNDLKLREGIIYIKDEKKSKSRILHLNSNQIVDLFDYKKTVRPFLEKLQNKSTNFLFLPLPKVGESKAFGSGTLQIWRGLSNEVRLLNPKFVNFRQVRASVISEWLKRFNLRRVQYMAGHKYISSTEGYFANQTENILNDIDRYHPIL